MSWFLQEGAVDVCLVVCLFVCLVVVVVVGGGVAKTGSLWTMLALDLDLLPLQLCATVPVFVCLFVCLFVCVCLFLFFVFSFNHAKLGLERWLSG